MEIKKENIKKVLSEVIDPEFGMDIVSLGFVKNIKIEESKVTINLKLTTPGCPLTSFFLEEIKDKVGKIKGVSSVEINLVDGDNNFNKLPRSKLSRYSDVTSEKFVSLLPSSVQQAVRFSASRNK